MDRMSLAESTLLLSESKKKKADNFPLTPKEHEEVKERFGDNLSCSFFKDKQGYFCTTHRARSKSYDSISAIPMKDFKFVSSTS